MTIRRGLATCVQSTMLDGAYNPGMHKGLVDWDGSGGTP